MRFRRLRNIGFKAVVYTVASLLIVGIIMRAASQIKEPAGPAPPPVDLEVYQGIIVMTRCSLGTDNTVTMLIDNATKVFSSNVNICQSMSVHVGLPAVVVVNKVDNSITAWREGTL